MCFARCTHIKVKNTQRIIAFYGNIIRRKIEIKIKYSKSVPKQTKSMTKPPSLAKMSRVLFKNSFQTKIPYKYSEYVYCLV